LRHAPASAENRYVILNRIRGFLPGLTNLIPLELLESQESSTRKEEQNQ